MKVLVILGLPLSGKTTHAKAIKNLGLDIPLYETGTFVYKAVEEAGLEAIPENIVKIAGECKAKSDSYFTERALEYAEQKEGKDALIFMSGVKAQSEVDYIKKKVGEDNFFMISFHASAGTRHARLLNKDRMEESSARGGKAIEDKAMAADIDRFNLRDDKELGYGLGRLMALAHYVINTEDKLWPYSNFEKTLEEFKTIIEEIKAK